MPTHAPSFPARPLLAYYPPNAPEYADERSESPAIPLQSPTAYVPSSLHEWEDLDDQDENDQHLSSAEHYHEADTSLGMGRIGIRTPYTTSSGGLPDGWSAAPEYHLQEWTRHHSTYQEIALIGPSNSEAQDWQSSHKAAPVNQVESITTTNFSQVAKSPSTLLSDGPSESRASHTTVSFHGQDATKQTARRRVPIPKVKVTRRSSKASFICPVNGCRTRTNREADMRRHLNVLHSQRSTFFRCDEPQCPYETARKDKVDEHIRKKQHCHYTAIDCSGGS